MSTRRSGMLRIKRKRQREIEREKRLHAHYCETNYREKRRGGGEREREITSNAESAMWTQSRSSDQLIDCLHGGYYLGVSSWVGWQTLYWKRHHERMNSTWDLLVENTSRPISTRSNPFLSHPLRLDTVILVMIVSCNYRYWKCLNDLSHYSN